jgi:hypothetical protein
MSINSPNSLKVADTYSYVKQFNLGASNFVNWGFKTVDGLKMIEPILTNNNNNVYVYIPNDLIVNKDLYVYGTILNPSDIKLKDNIKPISIEQTNNLLNLYPVQFSYKNDKSSHFGMLAQDVEKVFPELVKIKNNYMSVNYHELIPIIISKMKQMQNEIDELKKCNATK